MTDADDKGSAEAEPLLAQLLAEPRDPCPKCGSRNVVPILWGYPGDPAIRKAYERGELALGGCVVNGDGSDAKWRCRECRHDFGVSEGLDDDE